MPVPDVNFYVMISLLLSLIAIFLFHWQCESKLLVLIGYL